MNDVTISDQSQADVDAVVVTLEEAQRKAVAVNAGITINELEYIEQRVAVDSGCGQVRLAMAMISTLCKKKWILEGLLERGDQLLIAGAPKTGKSLLASQIALAVTCGGRFLAWQAAGKMQVVYVNLEIRRSNFGERIRAQIGGWQNFESYADLGMIDDIQTVDVLNADDRSALQKRIAEFTPDLVIFDVLARCHNADEQSQSMKSVMLSLRVCAGGAASIVVHHARKAAHGMDNVSQQASDIRGSSAIHGEVDTAIVLTKRSGQGARFALTFSARNVDVPDELLLDRGDDLLFFEAKGDEVEKLKTAVQSIFNSHAGSNVLATNLIAHICKAYSVNDRRAQAYIKQAIDAGLIFRSRREDKKYEYCIADGGSILRVVK